MARERNPNRDKAKQIYIEHEGNITNRQIAEMLGENEKVVAVWKQRDKWNDVVQPNESCTTKVNDVQQCDVVEDKVQEDNSDVLIENDTLTEKQRLFCIYYVKSFNATQAAIKAGYAPESAHVRGSELVRNSKVAAEIRRVKQQMTTDIFVEAMDVLNKYIKIAFADITDYVTFGQKEVPVMGMFGPVKDENGNIMMQKVNYVDFKESSAIDGTIVSEVKQGKDGVAIKFVDKMKALEKLSQYFDLFPDSFKRKIEEEKLRIEREKLEIAKRKSEGEEDVPTQLVVRRWGQ
jgi:phage terminase small subunit